MVFILSVLLYLVPFFLLAWLARLATRNLGDKKKKKIRFSANGILILGAMLIVFGGDLQQTVEFKKLCRDEAGYVIYAHPEANILDFEREDGTVDWARVSEYFVVERGTEYVERFEGRIRKTHVDFFVDGEHVARNVRISSTSGGIYKGLGVGSSCPELTSYQPMYIEILQGE